MDCRTGEIHQGTLDELLRQIPHKDVVPVSPEDMTDKQKEELKVSLNDHKSKLGKQLTEERKKRHLTKNQIRRLKRQGKLR